jgi:hypothetical protein
MCINGAYCTLLQAQINVALTPVSPVSEDHGEMCFDYAVRADNALEGFEIASQNIRLFYDSSQGVLMPSKTDLLIDKDIYQLMIAQDMSHVNAAGTGELAFEKDLGFINASIILSTIGPGATPFKLNTWQSLARFCFNEIKDTSKPITLIFARESITDAYGRAFVEISAINPNDEQVAVKINDYQDSKPE